MRPKNSTPQTNAGYIQRRTVQLRIDGGCLITDDMRSRQGMSGEYRRLVPYEPATRPSAVDWRKGKPRSHS
jgi:hypothetical protein